MKKKSDTDIKDNISVKDLVSKLGVSPENGLTDSEANDRISKFRHLSCWSALKSNPAAFCLLVQTRIDATFCSGMQ